MYSNFRRSAQASVAKVTFRPTPATEYADRRRPMVAGLAKADQHVLNHTKAIDGRTEADVFMVLRGENPGKGGRAAVETDSAPRIIASEIVGLDKFQHTVEFGLPLRVVHDPEWRLLVPDFHDWLLTSGRYPSYNEASQVCVPQSQAVSVGMKKPSEVDKLEVYFGFLSGTLDEYWRKGDVKHAQLVWHIVHTLRSVLSDPIGKDLPFEQFAELVEKRDATHADAVAFKKAMSESKPSAFYGNTLRAMGEHHELVHKSRFMSLDYLLLGLMTLPSPVTLEEKKQDSGDAEVVAVPDTVYTANANNILRTILERTIRWATNKDMRNFLDRAELVNFVQTNVGGRIESSLRWWAFFTSVLQQLLLGPVYGPESFVRILSTLRTEISDFKGGLSGLSLLISPQCQMRDDDLAEFVLSAAEAEQSSKKFATLKLAMVDGPTPLLDAVLQQNIARLQKEEADAQARAQKLADMEAEEAAAALAAESAKAAEATEAADKPEDMVPSESNIQGPWDAFRTDNPGHVGSPPVVSEYIRTVVALARDGKRPQAVEYMCNKADETRMFGIKRSRHLARRFAPEGSAVSLAFLPYPLVSITNSKSTTRRLICDLWRSTGASVIVAADHTKKSAAATTAAPGGAAFEVDLTPASFVKFEVAREMTAEYRLRIEAMQGDLQFECAVCLDKTKAKPVVLHREYRHAVCSKCAPELSTCPFCRASLA